MITLETWRRTTVRIARQTISADETAIDRHDPSQDTYLVVAPVDDTLPTGEGVAGQGTQE